MTGQGPRAPQPNPVTPDPPHLVTPEFCDSKMSGAQRLSRPDLHKDTGPCKRIPLLNGDFSQLTGVDSGRQDPLVLETPDRPAPVTCSNGMYPAGAGTPGKRG
jgi:hypothetical protein